MIKYTFCNANNKIETYNKHRSGQRGPDAYDINSRVVLGCFHAGIGHTNLNNLLSTANVPSISRNTFKQREKAVGRVVEGIAVASCKESVMTEKEVMRMVCFQ